MVGCSPDIHRRRIVAILLQRFSSAAPPRAPAPPCHPIPRDAGAPQPTGAAAVGLEPRRGLRSGHSPRGWQQPRGDLQWAPPKARGTARRVTLYNKHLNLLRPILPQGCVASVGQTKAFQLKGSRPATAKPGEVYEARPHRSHATRGLSPAGGLCLGAPLPRLCPALSGFSSPRLHTATAG